MQTKLRKRVQYKSDLPSKTQQHLKQDCDVNCILEKYRKTGMISHLRGGTPQYGDFSQIQDFRTNLELVQNAQMAFDALPSNVRKRFQNDPSQMMDFLSDDSNYDEALKLGLVTKKPETPKAPQNDDKTTKTEPNPNPAT